MSWRICSSSVSSSSETPGLAFQVAQAAACLEQGLERRNLVGHPGRLEILDRLEGEVDRHVGAIIGKLVGHLELEAGRDARHHVVEIIPIDLDELPVGQGFRRFRWVTGIVAHDADHERKLADDRGSLGLDLVGDMHAGFSDARKLLVYAVHGSSLDRSAPRPEQEQACPWASRRQCYICTMIVLIVLWVKRALPHNLR